MQIDDLSLLNIPQFPIHRPITMADVVYLKQKTAEFRITVCELCPANLFLWRSFDCPHITQLNGNILIKLDSVIEIPFYLEPLGNNRIEETVQTVLNAHHFFARVSEHFISLLPENMFKIVPQPNQYDYIFDRLNFVAFNGRKFDGKRNHINKFKKMYSDYQYLPLNQSSEIEALKLYDRWSAAKIQLNELSEQSYLLQKSAIQESFRYFEPLSCFGGAIFVDNEIKGFVMATELNPQTANIHFFYGDSDVHGIYPILIQEASRQTFTSFQYLNFEQDMGLPGLRKSKESYYPICKEQKFQISILKIR